MLHIDGDLLTYRIACAVGDDGEAWQIKANLDSYITKEILMQFDEATPYAIYLSPSDGVFRDSVAVTAPYKGQRGEKPKFLALAREHLQEKWGARIEKGLEADDLIATAVTEQGGVIVSIDKDFNQLPVQRYDFVQKTWEHPTEDEAVKNLYKQVLTGDAVDNIIGVEGCGPALASMLIDGCTKEIDMILICVDQLGMKRFRENIQLVFLLRGFFATYFNWVDRATLEGVGRVLQEIHE